MSEQYEDGEIIGIQDGYIIQWNGDDNCPYNCGETPEEFGYQNMWPKELARLMDAGVIFVP